MGKRTRKFCLNSFVFVFAFALRACVLDLREGCEIELSRAIRPGSRGVYFGSLLGLSFQAFGSQSSRAQDRWGEWML